MRVFITGGTGLIGRHLAARLQARGDSPVILTRDAHAASGLLPAGVCLVEGDPTVGGPWQEVVSTTDAIVNLAGEPIFGRRWTKARKRIIGASRINTTENVVEAMTWSPAGPKTLISGSGVGFYGPQGDDELGEDAPTGSDWFAQLAVSWEAAARAASKANIRVVLLRTGIVLARAGGALAQMMLPFRLHVGGPIGGGRQCVSWIHVDDLIEMIVFALDNPALEGPLNGTAPCPCTNRRFAETLAEVLGRRSWLPTPGILLRIALGEVANVAVSGQRVVPAKALAARFSFRYTDLPDALHQILAR